MRSCSAHLLRESGLIADGGRHPAEKRGDFAARLHEAEDVVDEKQNVLVAFVAEEFRHGEPCEPHAHTHAGRLVHLSEDERGLFRNAALVHLRPKLVALAAALAHAREDGIAAVLGGDIVDKLLDEDGLAHARAAEETDLAALGIGLQKVDGFDARLEDLHRGALLGERGGGTVDAHALGVGGKVALAVNGVAEDVEHPAQRDFAYGDGDGAARRTHSHAAREPLALGQHDAAHAAVVEVLRHFHDLGLAVRRHRFEGVFEEGEPPFETDVHDGTGDPDDHTFFHPFAPLFCMALAPEVISVISRVMAACLTRLNSSESSESISSALLSAPSIATILAFCSQQ